MQLSRTRSTDSILVLMINERKNYVTENRFFKSVVIKKKGAVARKERRRVAIGRLGRRTWRYRGRLTHRKTNRSGETTRAYEVGKKKPPPWVGETGNGQVKQSVRERS